MTSNSIETYFGSVTGRIEKRKNFIDPFSGKKYRITEWHVDTSSMASELAIKIKVALIQGYNGVTYVIKKKRLLGSMDTKLIISLLYPYPKSQEELNKIISALKKQKKDRVSYILCFPTTEYEKGKWRFPTMNHIYFVVADLANRELHADVTDDKFKGFHEIYQELFMPHSQKITSAKSNKDVADAIVGYIERTRRFIYPAPEVASKLSMSVADVEEGFKILEKRGYLRCHLEKVGGKNHLYLFSIQQAEAKNEGVLKGLETKMTALLMNKGVDELDDYKKRVNEMDISLTAENNELNSLMTALNKWYEYYSKKNDSSMVSEVVKRQGMIKKEIGTVHAQKERLWELKRLLSGEQREVLPEDAMEGVVKEEKPPSKDEIAYNRKENYAKLVLGWGLPDEESKKLLDQAETEDWWSYDWNYESNKVCPRCDKSDSVSYRVIATSNGDKKIYYCDECGYVW